MAKKWVDGKGQKSKHIFKYYIVRRKLCITIAGVLSALLVVYGVAVLYFQEDWLQDFQYAASRAQMRAEELTQIYRRIAGSQAAFLQEELRLQELRQMPTKDAWAGAKERTNHSFGTFFPDSIRRIAQGGDVPLDYVTIGKGQSCMLISTENSEKPTVRYSVKPTSLPDERNYFTVKLKLLHSGNPLGLSEDITFWFGLAQIRQAFSGLPAQGVMLVEDNRVLTLAGEVEENLAVFRTMQNANAPGGKLWIGDRKIFYTRLSGVELTIASYTTVSNFFAAKASLLLAVFLLFSAFAVAFLLIFYFSLAQDARFVQQNLEVFAAVKKDGFFPDMLVGNRKIRSEYQYIYLKLMQTCGDLERYIQLNRQLKAKQQQAAMQMYQSQIQPHFLYNTLEIIRGHALLGNDGETARAIAALGGFYRNITEKKEKITLKEEVDLLERYLQLMQLCHPEDFVYQLDISPRQADMPTPKLWMQPLAENFFKHGYRGRGEVNVFVVRERIIGKSLYLLFSNNGYSLSRQARDKINREMARRPFQPGKSIGLANVYARLKGFYGKDFSMKILHNRSGGSKVLVKLPVDHAEGW